MSGRIEATGVVTRALFVAAVTVLLVAGCADNDRGDQANLIGDPAMGSPESTWQYMARALSEQSAVGWTNSLSGSFEYIPDAVSDARYPGALSSWGRADEAAFVQAVAAGDLEIAANLNVLDSPCPVSDGSSFSWPEVEYSVVVSGSGGSNPITYRGVATLEFELQGIAWYLTRWTDLSGAPAPWNEDVMCPTLGELRAVYRGE